MSTERHLALPITGFGAKPSTADVEVKRLTAGERLRRGAMAPLIGLGVAVAVLPIPIVHLAVPPMAIVSSIFWGVHRARVAEVFASAHGPCPFCGADQTFGLTGAAFRLPRGFKCRACLQLLTLESA
ncbi:MAG TPA: hypothetical protein VMG41_03375 [Gemmatimonadales bacterium]|nr:hypothetical protein [Gemmatimonadales bacterium]